MVEATARRVLHVVDVGSLDGGAQRLALDLILNLRAAGWEPMLACPQGELLDRVCSTGISAHAVNFDARLSFRTVRRLIEVVHRRRVAVVHSHLPMSNVHGHVAATATRTAHVGTLHGEGSLYSRRFIRFLTVGRRTGLSLVSVSSAAATSIQRLIGGCPIPYIYNGIDTDRFDSGTVATTENVHPVIGCVGRLHRDKGQDVLVRAFARVLHEHPTATLALVGDGDERPRLKSLASEIGCENNVIFYGYQRDVRALIEGFTICVVPSNNEAFGIAILEAGAMRKPVVASCVGGIAEILGDGPAGLLVPAGQPVALAEGLLSLLRDPDRAARLADALCLRVRTLFSIRRSVERYASLYGELLA